MKSKILIALPLLFLVLSNQANAREMNCAAAKRKQVDEKGSIFLSAYVERFEGVKSGREIRITTVNGEAGYYLWKNFALIGNVHLIETEGERVVLQNGNRLTFDGGTSGWGLALRLRFDVVRLRGAGLYIDAGGGMIYTSDEFPPGGTDWNYTFRPGIGISVRLLKSIDLEGGIRYLHISNGKKGRGFRPNPAYDGFGFFLGLLYGW